jgi:tetratricopeptide (TPR) repeat protein
MTMHELKSTMSRPGVRQVGGSPGAPPCGSAVERRVPRSTGAVRRLVLSLGLAAAAAAVGCTGFQQRGLEDRPAGPSKAERERRMRFAGASVPVPGRDQVELEVWNDPAFRIQFVESYKAETDIEPPLTTEEREVMREVLDLMGADKRDEAARLLKRNRNEAASAAIDFTLANIHFEREQLDKAAPLYEEAVEKHPKFRRAWRNLGVTYVRQNRFEKALPALTKVIELGGGDAIMHGLLGFAYSSVGNPLPAESAYRMAILLDPATLDWKMGLAQSFFRQQRFAEAVALCGKLIERYPDRADLWLLQANAYIGLDEPLKAVQNYEFVDRLGEADADALNMMGDIYINEELFDLAVRSYVRAMEQRPDAEPDRAVRGAKVLASRGATDETRQLVETIEEVHGARLDDETRKELLKLRARVALVEDKSEEHARVLKEIIELDPLDGEALISLGQYYADTGDPDQAIFYFQQATAIEEHEADALLRHAQLLVREGKYADALPLLRRAQQIRPREAVQEYLEKVERVAQSNR